MLLYSPPLVRHFPSVEKSTSTNNLVVVSRPRLVYSAAAALSKIAEKRKEEQVRTSSSRRGRGLARETGKKGRSGRCFAL